MTMQAETEKNSYLGTRVRRLVDKEIYTGRATYVDDIVLPGMLHVAILRSPHPHARIEAIDLSRVLRQQGVVAAVTGQDLVDSCNPIPSGGSPWLKTTKTYPIAVNTVRYVGDAVAAVAAVDRRTASEALNLINVEYEVLPAVCNVEQAGAVGAPLLYEEWGTNLMLSYHYESPGIDDVFKSADYVFRGKVSIQRQAALPLETRGYIAMYETRTGHLTFWGSIQQPHRERSILSEMLGLPEARIRVIQPFVGGAFGVKARLWPEEPLVCILSMRTGRPVKWIEDRRESFISGGHSKDYVHHYEVAVTKDGAVLALRDKIVADFGTATPPIEVGAPQVYVTGMVAMPGPYAIRHYSVDLSGYVTNKAPWAAYRGYGKQEANFAYERIMDHVARELGHDPAEIRFTNFIQPDEFPYEAATGEVYDSGNYPGALSKALELSGYRQIKAEQEKMRREGRYVGIGISCFLEPCGAGIYRTMAQAYDLTKCHITPDGRITVATGITSGGTGNETMVAQVVADELGAHIDDITVLQGDTDSISFGLGNWSDRSAIVGASSAALAARDLREKVLTIAAYILGEDRKNLILRNSTVSVGGKERKLSLRELARKFYWETYTSVPPGVEPLLESTKAYMTPNVRHHPDAEGRVTIYPIWTNGVHVAVSEVDIETGHVNVIKHLIVDDCGTQLNPGLVEAQVYGAFASQGIGGALYEEIVYSEDGQPLTTTLMDYMIPTAMEVPPVVVAHQVTPSPFTVYGSKGCGEGGLIGAAAAIASSVEDALSPLGVEVRSLPLTPQNVWKLIHERQKEQGLASRGVEEGSHVRMRRR
jgi:aerobic carbon-monoxide dehydrogenase large subunit